MEWYHDVALIIVFILHTLTLVKHSQRLDTLEGNNPPKKG